MVNHNKLLLCLCNPTVEFLLFPRLLEVIKKYTLHFNKRPILHSKIIESFIKRIGDINDDDKLSIKKNVMNIVYINLVIHWILK